MNNTIIQSATANRKPHSKRALNRRHTISFELDDPAYRLVEMTAKHDGYSSPAAFALRCVADTVHSLIEVMKREDTFKIFRVAGNK